MAPRSTANSTGTPLTWPPRLEGLVNSIGHFCSGSERKLSKLFFNAGTYVQCRRVMVDSPTSTGATPPAIDPPTNNRKDTARAQVGIPPGTTQ